MNSTILQSGQLCPVCDICNAKLPGPAQAESHYASRRHMNNLRLLQKELTQSTSSSSIQEPLDPRATMSDFEIPPVFQKPINASDGPFEIFDCDLCNLQMTKMELSKHVKEFPHCNLIALKTNLLNKGIDKPFYSLNNIKKSIHCTLCKIDMFSDQDCQMHFNGKNHLKNFNTWCHAQNSLKPAVSQLDLKNSNCGLNSINADNKYYTRAEHKRPENVSSVPSSENFKCYLCKMSIVRSKKNEHVKNFPHADLSVIRTQLIKMEKNAIKCNLCNAIMQTSQVVKSHFEGKGHVKNFNSWYAQQPVEDLCSRSKNKWYYCQVCSLNLDGTSDAANHYEGRSHLKRVAETNPNFDNLKLEGFVANLTQGNVVQNDLNLEETAKVKPPELFLRTQIFNEIEKLVQTLYFSKKVPYEVSLHHLKKINRDVEDIVKKHQKTNIHSSSEISDDKFVSSEGNDSTVENGFFVIESQDKSVETADNNEETSLNERNPEVIIDDPETVPEMLKIVNKEESCDKSISSEVNDATVEDEFLLLELRKQSSETANNSEKVPLDEKQTKAIIDDLETVPEIQRIVEIEKSRFKEDTCNLEVEILVEVEELLRQIEDPQAPFREILKYLKSFNEVLEDLSVLEREIL
ncbi:zinc finger protein 385B-like isoform X2 [Euwallacea similis]|uniref:zinc finger protein 385B-like isoform X2 n=1 Tax=Euwallacea similis TaxID=1736056 RepID=UPI00344DDDDC